MLQSKAASLWQALDRYDEAGDRCISSREKTVSWRDLLDGDPSGQAARFDGASVLVATTEQLATIAALVKLDGTARRVVLYPPDLSLDHLEFVAKLAAADLVVSDRVPPGERIGRATSMLPTMAGSQYRDPDERGQRETEWVLLTSGTTGLPKLVLHTLGSLAGAIDPGSTPPQGIVWSTFYDIRRYGGLQIFLRAALTGTSLVLSDAREPTAEFLARAGAREVTHISGTPTQWRRALMSSAAHLISPTYVRLSGEIADQGILDQLSFSYPHARISHAFASTEAGVAFEVKDGLAGFEANALLETPGVDLKVESGTLRIRSDRNATCYLNHEEIALKDADGFVDTGDLVVLRNDRYEFVGRGDGVINVGGLKVHPEEVEAVLNRHPDVRMSLVRNRRNPITGALVIADVVLQRVEGRGERQMQQEILSFCRQALPAYKVPISIQFVSALEVADTGKLIRSRA